jgi:hypothetical protein
MSSTTLALADHILTFAQALDQAELLARQSLPTVLHERLSAAYALVKGGQAFQLADGSWDVASTSTPGKQYHINGVGCSCADAHYRAPQGRCKHVLSTLLARKALALMAQTPAPVPEPAPARHGAAPVAPISSEATVAAPVAPAGIDPRYLTYIQGRPFVRFDGLLALAHARGLVELSTTIVHVTSDFAVCQAVVRFHDGLVRS